MHTNLFRLFLAVSLLFSTQQLVQMDTFDAMLMPVASAAEKPLQIRDRNLNLLQPLDDSTTTLPPSPNIQIFFTYFGTAWPWVLGVAAGIGVLQALIGGIQMMLSGSDSGMNEAGKTKIMWALAGLLMVGLAGFILRTLNPIFYT